MKFIFYFYFLLLLNWQGISQLSIENKKIRNDFNKGKLSPIVANKAWQNLQKKYGDNATTIEIYGWRALAFYSIGNTDQCIKLMNSGLNEALKIKNDSLTFKFQSDIAGIYRYEGNFDSCLVYFEKCNKLYKSNPKLIEQIPEYIFSLYNNYGTYKQVIGDYIGSLYLLDIAKKIVEPKYLDGSKPWPYSNAGKSLMILNRDKEATKNINKAIKYSLNFEDIANNYLTLSEIFEKNKDWSNVKINIDLAESNFNKSLKRKAGSVFPSFEIKLANQKGNYFLGASNFYLAEKNYTNAIAIGAKYSFSNTTINYVIQAYKNLSVAQVSRQNYSAVLQNLQKALQYNSTGFGSAHQPSDNIAENPKLESIKYKNDAIEIYKEKIIALLAIYKKEGKKEYLEYALSTVNSVHELINYQRNSFQLEGSKLFLSEQAHAIYGLAIEAAHQKYKLTNDAKYIDLAFRYSEANKSVVLFESIKANEKSTFNGVPQTLIDEENVAIKNMAIYENQLYKDAKNEDLWRKKLIDITDQLAKLKFKFKKEYSQYYNYKYNNESIKIAELQSKLTTNQSVIEYFLHENSLFTFLVTKAGCKFIKQNLTVEFKSQITDFRNKLITKSIDEVYQKLSFSIYSTLFPTTITQILAKEKTNHVKIVADGVLNQIPFESLLTKKPKSLKETNIYLLEKYVIGYLPSATMNWKQAQAKKATWRSKSYLGYAPQYKNGLDLPINQATVGFLANDLSGESFLKSNATVANFDKYSKENTKILHLSMHGGASPTDPMESYLAFGSDSLFAHDIYTKSIPTDLAILDACETGVGQVNNGEGVLNLARAFLHAGGQAVAMSLWKLTSSDETANITKDFAKLVLDGSAKDQALNTAKLNYLEKHRNDLLLSHPFYWSPLIVIGNTQAIESSYFVYWFLLSIVLFFLFIKIKRKLK